MVAARFTHYPKVMRSGIEWEAVYDRETDQYALYLDQDDCDELNADPTTARRWGWEPVGTVTVIGTPKPEPEPKPEVTHAFTPRDLQPHIVVKVNEPDGSYAFGHLEAVVSIVGEGQAYKLVGGVTVPLKEGSTIERWDFS